MKKALRKKVLRALNNTANKGRNLKTKVEKTLSHQELLDAGFRVVSLDGSVIENDTGCSEVYVLWIGLAKPFTLPLHCKHSLQSIIRAAMIYGENEMEMKHIEEFDKLKQEQTNLKGFIATAIAQGRLKL